MEKSYTTFTAEQFLDDPYFIEWIKQEDPKTEEFWKQWVEKQPPNLDSFLEAKKICKLFFSSNKIVIDQDEANSGWQKVVDSINSQPRQTAIIEISIAPKFKKKYWKLSVAAAVLLVFSALYYYLILAPGKKKSESDGTEIAIVSNDIAPGNNDAVIILSNGASVSLDSSKPAELAKEQNVTVEKLTDGSLSYNISKKSISTELIYNTLVVPRGGKIISLKLSDGTRVWINAGSSLKFPVQFVGNERKMELSGEAYFEVAHNVSMPCTVNIIRGNESAGEVQVLGTHFNINSYIDEPFVNATLLEGSVKVYKSGSNALLQPASQAQIASDGLIKVEHNINTARVIAWKNGFFSFENSNLRTVMNSISRWYNIEIIYSGSIPDIKFSGELDTNLTLNEMLSAMNLVRINYKLEGRRLTIKN